MSYRDISYPNDYYSYEQRQQRLAGTELKKSPLDFVLYILHDIENKNIWSDIVTPEIAGGATKAIKLMQYEQSIMLGRLYQDGATIAKQREIIDELKKSPTTVCVSPLSRGAAIKWCNENIKESWKVLDQSLCFRIQRMQHSSKCFKTKAIAS